LANFDFNDLTITSTGDGRIEMIRGEKLPTGILFAPIEPNTRSTISASAMQAMSAALHWALAAQKRARDATALGDE
jgi:hypothetical protein